MVDDGRIRAAGAPAEVMTVDTVAAAFGLECLVTTDPVAGSPLVVPIGRYHRGAA